MQEKNKVMKKNKFQIRRIRFYSAKVTSIQNPHRLPTEPMGIHHSPHTHTITITMGIPIPTAALLFGDFKRVDEMINCIGEHRKSHYLID